MAGETNILPIAQVRQQVTTLLRERGRLVLAAPTGSGKTTQIPRYLHEDLGLPGRIIVLQPRRLAAIMMARRVAEEMGCPITSDKASASAASSSSTSTSGVGYQTRYDSNIHPRNVIRFMTEGLLLRLMQDDPSLGDVSAVILDEFHERNIASDAALAMLKQLQAKRADLKILVMSATLDVQSVTRYLDCPAVEATGRTYDVAIHYTARQQRKTGTGQIGVRAAQPAVWDEAGRVLSQVLEAEEEGDVLVFMPGVHEINRTIEACMNVARQQVSAGRLRVLPLYSQLSYAQQQLALSPSPAGSRKVVVSTNVAETSLTIPGVRHVIDSGLARVNRYDSRRGVNTLWLEPISQASADQRAGRAGRTAPGTCWRLWPEFEHRGRAAQNTPEIRRLDPAQTILWLLSLGVRDPRQFDWLEQPDAPSMQQAMALLASLGAIDATTQALTPIGKMMAALPVHPRWARVLVAAGEKGCIERMSLWCALASQREITSRQRSGASSSHKHAPRGNEDGQGEPALQSDLQWLEEKFHAAQAARFDPSRCQAIGVHAAAALEVKQVASQLLSQARQAGMAGARDNDDVSTCIACLLEGFADHLAVMRGQGNLCAMIGQMHTGSDDAGSAAVPSGGGGARRACELSPQSMISPDGVFLALDVRETSVAGSVRTLLGLASIITQAQLEAWAPERIIEETRVVWNRQKLAAEEVWQRRFDDLVLEEIIRPTPDPAQASAMLAQMVTAGELKLEKWDDDVTQWIARVRSVGIWFPEAGLIEYDADDVAVLHQEICEGATRYNQIKDRPCMDVVRSALDWQQQQFVEKMAPARLQLPGGWRMPITYFDDGSPPRGRGKIQDFYDVTTTPTVAGGRVKLLLEILGPNYRPVQLTQDLAGFWENLYPQLKKELRRRYPRQTWR